jgi:hypothetical protein
MLLEKETDNGKSKSETRRTDEAVCVRENGPRKNSHL